MTGRTLALLLPCLLTCASSLLAIAQPAHAQAIAGQRGPKSVPHEGYFSGFGYFYDGDFLEAGKEFRDAARTGIASTEGRWIDSICYHAMIGECYYQMGDLKNALEQYTSALQLYLNHRDWMLRVEFPPGIEPEQNNTVNITWGSSARTTKVGHFQARYQSLQGRFDNDQVLQKGGVVSPPQLYPVYVSEIVRCTTLAMARRREILGPTSEHDALTLGLLDALSRRPGPPNHWAQCWIELQLGVAYASANKLPQAASELTKSLLANGQYDHPLTCVGLVELGRLAFEQAKYDAAMTFFHEATISAAFFERYDVMEEGFRLGALAHSASGQKGIYPPLAPAAAASRKYRMIQVSVLASLAELLCTAGDLADANSTLNQARSAMSRRDMAQGAIGSRVNYQAARVLLQSGEAKGGGAALAAALKYQANASKRLFQIGLVDSLFTTGTLTERICDLLYTDVLREPNRLDWTVDPLDTLAVNMSAHPQPYEHWFELALTRKEYEKALNIAERIKRHRYYATQALGGRLLALRWVLEAPKELLTDEAILQRQDLLVRYPRFNELAQAAAASRTRLEALPLSPSDAAEQKQQSGLLSELAAASAAQEGLIQLMALERIPSEFAFPPLRDTKEFQQNMPPGTLLFYYIATARNVHAFALSRDKYGYFSVAQPGKIKTDVAEMLRGLGHYDRNQPVPVEDLLKDAWRTPASRLLGQLTNQTKPEEWGKYKELVIVPDGVLWYLPFEAFPITLGAETSPLLNHLPIRYAPTLGLSLPDRRGLRPVPKTAIVAGRLLPREEQEAALVAAEHVAAASPGSALFAENLIAPSSVLASTFNSLVVMADLEDMERLPFGWSPMKLDAGKPGSTLSDWGQLPWTGVEQIVLPGFHTPAEFGLKKGGTGDEVFLAACGLMASGTRTALLSRWRVGGKSTTNLMKEFVQELPHDSAASAWRRAVELCGENILDPATEGRLKATATSAPVKADHPFFWAGYLLIDTGLMPTIEAAPAAAEKPAPAAEPEK